MIQQLLTKLSVRMHAIDAIHARQEEMAAQQAQQTALLQQQVELLRGLEARLNDMNLQAQGHFDTLLQAEFGSRAINIDPHIRTYAMIEALGPVLGRMESRLTASLPADAWDEAGFAVTSQFGEDGFLQHLIRHVPLPQKTFIEFGVEDYREANTRFLLLHNRWRGLVLEGNEAQAEAIRRDLIYWRRDLTVASAFVTRENIDTLFAQNGFQGEIGLLSIDIDGNDLWLWQAIQSVNPRIVVVEYNYRFGTDVAATIPYNPSFSKSEAHPTHIYYGTSLRALAGLADERGYDLVGCSDGGVNAFFVRRDCRPESLPRRSVKEAFRAGQHAEVYDPEDPEASPVGVTGIVRRSMEWQQELLLSLPLERFPEWEKADL